YRGYIIDLLDEMSKNLNFTYKIRIVADGQYGSQYTDKNGALKWTGVIGEVIDGIADMAAAPLSITPERQQALDFTMPFMNQGLTVLTLTKKNEANSLFQAFLPLKIEVWIGILISLIVVAIATTCMNRWSPFDYYGKAAEKLQMLEDRYQTFSFGNTLWYTLGSFLSQGADRTPRSISARLITAIWWLSSVIIIATYTANLTAFLTVSSLQTTFNSLHDLAKSSGMGYGVLANSSIEYFFLNTAVSPYQEMKHNLKNVRSNMEGVQRVLSSTTEHYAYIGDAAVLKYAKSQYCNLTTVGSFKEDSFGLALPKESLYWKEVSIQILRFREEGFLETLQTKWY
ncbi:uncharacterized protein TRIADDRAFT_3218, partial [Trichoplax adhaerens]